MNDLCSIELLQNAVARGLSAEEESALHAHLEHCEACCAQMEQLAGGKAWQQEAAALLSADELDAAVPEPANWSEVDFSVEHLDPSDDTNVLGQLGSYDVLAIVGRGGMGVVLKAFDRELKRLVAIKALAPHLAHSSVARKRFAREAQAAAAVVNPHVIAIHHVQPTGRLPFLIMPLLTGESLAQRLKARGPLELTEVLRIGMQAATGLAAAHDQGLVHRDVKPANIFLEKGVERVVITDFGLARAADDVSMTRMGVVAGTPEYMSPEQARDEALDGRSDLFSLGCVLYEMATGVSPFRTDSTMATLRRIVDEPPAAMASLVPELPPWFCHIVERLLSKDPAQRFASASEVSQLLEQCLSHLQQPTSVPLPASLVPHAKCRRSIFNSTRIGVLAMLGTIGMALLGMLLWQAPTAPDISGQWTGDEWGTVVLEAKQPGQYEGTFDGSDKNEPAVDLPGKVQLKWSQVGTQQFFAASESGKIQLKWSRVERRFNGTWKAGDDRKGKLSLRLVGDEIRGAWTTSKTSLQPTGTARLSEFIWNRSSDNATTSPPSYIRKLLIGKIQSIDIERRVARIDLGTADSVTVGMRFYVSAKAGLDVKESPFWSKGSIEVIRILDRHISEVRILNEDLKDKLTVNDEVIGVDKSQSLETDESLEGVWELAYPPDIAAKRLEDERLRLVIAGDWQGRFQGDQRVSASRLKVEPQHTPKRLSFVGVDGKPMRGIYEVKEDGLRLSIAPDTEALPTKFGTEHPEFKRVKGKLAEEQLAALKSYSKKATTTDASGTTPPNDGTAALHPPSERSTVADDSLEGVWEFVLPSAFATEGPEDKRRRLVFSGNWFAIFEGSQRLSASRIKVEPQHTPKRISGVDIGAGWAITHGIYEVDGDRLRLSLAPDTEALPTKFGPEHLKRVKGKLAEEQLAALKQHAKKAATNATSGGARKLPADSDQNSPTGGKTKFDKTTLPKVSRDFHTRTTVLNGLVSGGGIIEHIEGDTIHLRSGDRIVVPAGTMLLVPKHGKCPMEIYKSDLLEPGMAIAYSIRDGKIEKPVLIGILEQAPGGKSVFDTIKELQLRKGNGTTASSVDGRFPMRITSSDGEVTIKIGETKLIKLPKPTESMEWRVGEFEPDGIEDIEPFDYVLVQWRDNGHLAVTCYASPPKDEAAALHPPFEFRIAASKADREADGVAWFPIVEPRIPAPAGKSGANLPIEEKVEEQWRGLLWNKVEHTLLSDGLWRVVKCDVIQSAQSTDLVPSFDIQVKLDAVGGALLRRLTATHLNQQLAVVVEGTIVAAPIIRSEFGEEFVITGNFSKAAAEKLAAAIRKPDPRKIVVFGLRFADAKTALAALKEEATRRNLHGFEATLDPRMNSIVITAADADTLEALRDILGRLDTPVGEPMPESEALSKLAGVWIAEKVTESGEDLPTEKFPFELHFEIKKLTFRFVPPDSGKDRVHEIVVDETKTPATIDITWKKRGKKETAFGIFKLEGDRLWIHSFRDSNGQPSEKRPTTFDSSKEERSDLLVLTRKPAPQK